MTSESEVLEELERLRNSNSDLELDVTLDGSENYNNPTDTHFRNPPMRWYWPLDLQEKILQKPITTPVSEWESCGPERVASMLQEGFRLHKEYVERHWPPHEYGEYRDLVRRYTRDDEDKLHFITIEGESPPELYSPRVDINTGRVSTPYSSASDEPGIRVQTRERNGLLAFEFEFVTRDMTLTSVFETGAKWDWEPTYPSRVGVGDVIRLPVPYGDFPHMYSCSGEMACFKEIGEWSVPARVMSLKPSVRVEDNEIACISLLIQTDMFRVIYVSEWEHDVTIERAENPCWEFHDTNNEVNDHGSGDPWNNRCSL